MLIFLGLDPRKDRVLQVAMLVTDANLNVISSEFNEVIKQSEHVIVGMNDWCKENLKDLAEASKVSEVTERKAEDMMLEFLAKYVAPKKSPLAGNSIYMDRMFLLEYFPRVHDYLHYRIIDVSTIKEVCYRWNPKVYHTAPKKEFKHRALADIRESISEMQHYREKLFIVNN
jgi:oligoribonuclease